MELSNAKKYKVPNILDASQSVWTQLSASLSIYIEHFTVFKFAVPVVVLRLVKGYVTG